MSSSNTLVKEQNGTRYGRMIHPWLLKKEDMVASSPSRQDGMSYDDELSKRQQGGIFIYDIVQQLTHGKGEHGLSGVAVTIFNRFFNVHSFKRCDFRDIAASCVFLAGKNEDTPKKLKYVVNQLWHFKFPNNKQFPSEQHFLEQCNVVTYLEGVILRTISFDVNVDLPHQYILKLMRDIERGRNVYKEMVKTAYYMATDVLLITNWSVRYSCAAIATACINIAAFFHNIQMDEIVPTDMVDSWYKHQDMTMSRSEILAMTKEFLDIYSRNPQFHVGSLKKIDLHGKVKIVVRSPPQVTSSLTSSGSSTNLKKIDMDAYKERQRTTSGVSTSSDTPRQSFLPDVKNQKVVEEGMKKHHQRHQSNHNGHNNHHHRPSTSSSQYPGYSAPMKRPNTQEELYSAKKSRPDYQINFVSASSTSSSTTMNREGQYYQQTTHQESLSAYAIGVSQMTGNAPVPLMQKMLQPPPPPPQPSTYTQMCMDYKNNKSNPTISSTQQISPPDDPSPTNRSSSSMILLPPPPPPPPLPPMLSSSQEDMEEGEVL